MKIAIITTFAIVSIAIAAVCPWGCNVEKQSQATSYIFDNTEENFMHLAFEQAKSLSLLYRDPNAGEQFRATTITELNLNPVHQIQIAPVQSVLLGNEVDRGEEIEAYFGQMQEALSVLDTGKRERVNSVIFRTVAEELNHLSASDSRIRKLTISSDLNENKAGGLSFYDPRTLEVLKTQPDKIMGQLLEHYPLQDLSGIEVYLVHYPKDILSSERYEIVSNAYRKTLEGYGATVHVSATIPTEALY